jgi:hypothetical protein
MTPRLDVDQSSDPRARARLGVVRSNCLAESFQPGPVGRITIQRLRVVPVGPNPGLQTSLGPRSMSDDGLGGGRIYGSGIGGGLDAYSQM